MNNKKALITDLDGTLLGKDRKISNLDLITLEMAGDHQILRILATGRSLYSLHKVVPLYVPFDYIVFSSGAGIMDWKSQEIIKSINLKKEEVRNAFDLLNNFEVDFCIQDALPENHFYRYIRKTVYNPDFDRRNTIYTKHASEICQDDFIAGEACQLIAIVPDATGADLYAEIREKLPELKVIRSTSPIDGQSVWIEIFSNNVSKSKGVEFITERHGIQKDECMSLGNDYNDLDLLHWTKTSFVVNNSPDDLKSEFRVVNSNLESGFSEAVNTWLNEG